MKRILLLTLLLSVLISACSKESLEKDPPRGQSPSGTTSQDTQNNDGSTSSASGSAKKIIKDTDKAGSQNSKSASPFPRIGPATPVISGTVPIDVVVSPKCVSPGTVVRVTLTSGLGADAAITFYVFYPDGQDRGQYSLGRTDGEGSYRWAFAIPSDAPSGQGQLTMSASSNDAKHGGGGMVPFEIKKPKC